MSHSPAPWRIEPSFAFEDCYYIVDAKGRRIVDISILLSKANALLIAAAPELLAACKALQMEARARNCGLRIADEAIAKAEKQLNEHTT